MTSEETDPYNIPALHSPEIVRSAVEAILSKGGNKLYEKYLDDKSGEYQVDIVTNTIMTTLKMNMTYHDLKENDSTKQQWIFSMNDEPSLVP
jgi:hypothetical protein